MTVGGALVVQAGETDNGYLYVSGDTTLHQRLEVYGTASFHDTVDISGALTASGAASFNSSLKVAGDATLGQNVTISGWLDVEGNVTMKSHLFVSGESTFSSVANFNNGLLALNVQSLSDARLKKDFEEIEGALAKVQALHPVFYNWSNGSANVNPACKEIGMIAQEVEAILPNIVSTEAGEEGTKRVVYDRISVLLVAAMKEQSAIIEDLKARVSALEA
jgi:hypothetical protein